MERSAREQLEEDIGEMLGGGLVAEFERSKQEIEASVLVVRSCIKQATAEGAKGRSKICQYCLSLLCLFWRRCLWVRVSCEARKSKRNG